MSLTATSLSSFYRFERTNSSVQTKSRLLNWRIPKLNFWNIFEWNKSRLRRKLNPGSVSEVCYQKASSTSSSYDSYNEDQNLVFLLQTSNKESGSFDFSCIFQLLFNPTFSNHLKFSLQWIIPQYWTYYNYYFDVGLSYRGLCLHIYPPFVYKLWNKLMSKVSYDLD